MGSLISRFRKKPTTEEQLKKIEDGLKKIEDYKRSTERKHKKLIASIIIYSAALYILACVIVFVWYLPESWIIRLALLIPLVLVPVIVYFLKRLISRYFDSRMVKANEDYADLQRKKKDIIDSVMETETFNKAKEILSKYAPEKLGKKDLLLIPRTQTDPPSDLRKRNVAQSGIPNPPTRSASDPVTTLVKVPRQDIPSVSPTRPGTAPKQRLPQPVFPKERGISDKLIEFMIGDGPGYRYALICKHCQGHNGMALKEEFPYMAFNCCYCYQYNPARSKRPVPPKLPDIRELPVMSTSTPALPAPTSDSGPEPEPEPLQTPVRVREETMRESNNTAESSEKSDAEVPEDEGSDVKWSVSPKKVDDEENSDDESPIMGFSEADLDYVRQLKRRTSLSKEDNVEENPNPET